VALASLDAVISRLSSGMTAREQLSLAHLLERREPLSVADLVAWHEPLPPVHAADPAPRAELVAALAVLSR
jgi:hypothetical protein